MLRHLLAIAIGSLASWAWAEIPKYTVLTQLEGANITYQVEVKEVRADIYLTNRGDTSARCTVQGEDNYQKKMRTPEHIIHPTQTQPFMLRYTISVNRLQVGILCEPTDTPPEYKALYEQQQREYRAGKAAEAARKQPKLPDNPYKLP